jgi:hypothetical protein
MRIEPSSANISFDLKDRMTSGQKIPEILIILFIAAGILLAAIIAILVFTFLRRIFSSPAQTVYKALFHSQHSIL